MRSEKSGKAGATPSALVAGLTAGDERALGALYDAYGQVAYGLAFAIIGDGRLAESVVAESFGEAWRSASKLDANRTSVLAWLAAIVRRKALGVVRRHDGRLGAVGAGGLRLGTAKYPVGEALDALSATQRQAIELSYYRGFTVGEIAAELGEPENGARDLLRSAMQELRTALSTGAALEDHVVTRA